MKMGFKYSVLYNVQAYFRDTHRQLNGLVDEKFKVTARV